MDIPKFDWKLLIFGSSGVISWWKAWGYGVRIGVTALVIGLLAVGGLRIWRWIFPVSPVNMNKPKIHVDSGGVLNYNVTQESRESKPLARFVPYIDVNGGYGRSNGNTSGEQWEAVAGVRLEFDGIFDAFRRKR